MNPRELPWSQAASRAQSELSWHLEAATASRRLKAEETLEAWIIRRSAEDQSHIWESCIV